MFIVEDLPRRTQLYSAAGEFKCRVKRLDARELLANQEADAVCRMCGKARAGCVAQSGHEVILVLHPVHFNRGGPHPSITYREIEANAGAHGYIPRRFVKRKIAEMFEV